jgi:site-specific recombinase XerD
MEKNVIAQAISCIYDYEFVHKDFIEKLTIKGVTLKTIEAYTRNVAQIAMFFEINPLQLNEKQLNQYLFHLKTTRNGLTAFKHAIYSLRSLFQLNGKKMLKNKLPSIAQPERMPIVLSIEECKKLISIPVKFKERFLIVFMYSSGLRISEISKLKIGNIDTQRMQILVVQGKGNKDRMA